MSSLRATLNSWQKDAMVLAELGVGVREGAALQGRAVWEWDVGCATPHCKDTLKLLFLCKVKRWTTAEHIDSCL